MVVGQQKLKGLEFQTNLNTKLISKINIPVCIIILIIIIKGTS